MVKPAHRFVLIAAIFAWLPISELSAKELADYHLGDKIEADIVTPVKLVVVDLEATATLKDREGRRVPGLFRFYPNAPDEAEAAFRRDFAEARSNFLKVADVQFGRRALVAQASGSAEFLQLVTTFQRQGKAFPLTANLAGLWAHGESDEAIQSSLAAPLREAMKQAIIPNTMPDGWHTTVTVKFVPLPSRDLAPTLELMDRAGYNFSKTNLLKVSHARTALQKVYTGDMRPFGEFMTRYVQENCLPDELLQKQAIARRTEALWVASTYEAGQTVAKRGTVVTGPMLLAIGQLAEKTVASRLQERLVDDKVTVSVARERTHWLLIALGVVSLIALAAVWKLRRRPVVSLVPARLDSMAGGEMVVPAQAGPANLRQLLAPHLARLLMNKFVRRLIVQRTAMMAAQEKAATEILELEARLQEIHAPLQERLRAYEKRIGELEQQLSARDEQNRELIKAKIDVVKKQLEAEREKSRLRFN